MNKYLIGVVLLVVVIGIGVYAGASRRESAQTSDNAMVADVKNNTSGEAMMKSEGTTTKDDKDAMMAKSGSYEAYSPEKIALAADGKVVLFFRAGWCPTCRTLDANIKSNLKNIPASVTILDVNYDTETALKQKYGVTYQHTLVQVDAQGNMIKKWSSSPTLAALVLEIK